MEATQLIDDSILEESEEEDGEKRGEPLAKLMVLKNEHIPETELLLYQGENVLGRNPDSCSLPLVARSVSKQHTVISISMFRGNRRHDNVAAMETEALVWDLGSMNGTRKGRTKLTPHVRYALTEGECVVIADIPCQYVSVDKRVGQGHIWNPTNADSGRGRRTGPDRKAQLRGSPSPRNQGPERETGTPKTERQTEGRGVNGEMGAPTELDGKGRTPAKPLSLEQTPTQPERTLVPESESDSDGEREGRRDKRGKLFGKISDSESHMSSPTCSTFLSPTNKVIPESEDESPITPSSSAKNRPKKIVSFSEEESDMDGPRQQPRRRRAQVIVDDSEEEEEEKEGKEAKEALGEKETGKRTRGKEDVSVEVVNQVSQAERAGLTPSAPMVSTEDKFNTDSDTDVEGEEEMGLSAPVNGVKPPVATEPPTDSDPGQLHMDSDTDVEEGDTMGSDSKLMPTAADVERKPVDSIPVVQPTDIHLDSDTDVDDDNVVDVLDSATKVTSSVSDPVEKPADSAPAVQPVVFHGDSDTDVEEEDTDTHSKTVPESDASGIRTGTAGPQEIILGSDTDEEDNPFAPPASSRTAELLKPPTSVGPATAAPLEIRSDSDTDLEEDATQTMNPTPPNVATVTEDTAVLPSHTTTTTGAVTTTIALRSQDSDADTDAEEEGLEPKTPRCQPPAGMVPESDPIQEEMATQAFFSPSDPFRRGLDDPALPPVLRPTAALSCSASDSQEDDDFVVSETQSFVLEGQDQGHQSSLPVEPTLDATQPYSLEPSLGEDRGEQPSQGSFQLGLSDSSHLQARDQTSESTKAFSFPDGELEATQAYGAGAVVPTPSSRAFLAQTVATESTQAFGSQIDSDLEATQAYGSGGGSEEPGLGRRSAVFARNRQVDFALEATQAYAAQPRSDIEEEDEEGEETQPLEFPTTSNVATAETLPMSACEEEEGEEEKDLVGAKPSTPVRRGRSGGAREREEEEQETQTGEVLTNQYLSTAQTRDMVQESDDEEETKPDSPRRRGQSQKQTVEEEETQPSEFLTSSHISTAETQPMGTCDTEEEKEEDNKAKGRVQRGRGKESEAATSGVSSRGEQREREGEGGRKTTSTTELAPGPDNSTRNSTRRRTVAGTVVAPPAAVEVTVQDILSSEQFVARRTRSRSSSTNSHSSLNSEVPTCSVASVSAQIKGRGGGRGRKTGTESVPPSNSQSEQPPAPKPTARGRRSQKVEDDAPHPEINEKADSQEAGGTTRGQKRTSKANDPDPEVTGEETTPAQVTEDSSPPRGNGRGRGRGGQKDNTPESTATTAGGDTGSEAGVESKTGGKGRKWEEEKEESSGFKVPRGKANVPRGGRRRAAEEEKEEGEKEEKPASTPAKRGRASTAQEEKRAEEEKSMEGRGEKMEEEEAGTVQRKVRGRHSTVQIKKEEESVLDSNSMVPQTPKGNGRGKRSATVDSSPLAKSPRSSSASPLSSLSSPGTLCRARVTTQSYKVLFTGVGDEEGGKVVSRLGGSLAKGVADMTHLVTDRVRRTVKFLCAVARGVPVVTTDWLEKCGKLGRFLPTDRYLVKDREQENKFSFCLEESLRTASTQPLLQGYEVHVTRSVLPEPAQMKDIITCSGARFLSKMPSTQKTQAQTVVISCGEDWSLCAPALSASLPVLSAEFLLTGILQQRVDLVTHVLSAPKPSAQPGGKGQARGRKKT
ncbi:hypothetical protein J4Q44_G00021010 [Coregonus suidteri]|uniref:Mediator of DNA damage checkpoint protein 1 n=1 Tax=Coregonus suidteri TaxID=861788 RepID=A0AAN8MGS8_9TELE